MNIFQEMIDKLVKHLTCLLRLLRSYIALLTQINGILLIEEDFVKNLSLRNRCFSLRLNMEQCHDAIEKSFRLGSSVYGGCFYFT